MRISHPKTEGTLHISKCIKHQLLIDTEEMAELLTHLTPFYLHIVSTPTQKDASLILSPTFLQSYARYIEALKNHGNYAEVERECAPLFSSVLTSTEEALYAMSVSDNRFLVKPIKPLIQLQRHHFSLSNLDKKVHPMVFTQDSTSWGLQFSYPHVYQDPVSKQIAKVGKGPAFPNTDLFARLSKWVRTETLPAQFMYENKIVYSSLRIGKKCLSWIDSYLKPKGLCVRRACSDWR